MTQVTIGIPSQGMWKDAMGLSLAQAVIGLPYALHFSIQRGPYLETNRDACVTDALSVKSDYLVFIDTDIAFPPEALGQLIAHGKDVVGGNYYEKRLPLVSTVKLLGQAFDGQMVQRTFPTAPFQCAAVATGFLCLDLKRVVQCMAPPYFCFGTKDGKLRAGEDVEFCLRARKAGLQVWCDPTISLWHIGDYFFGPND